MTDTLAADALDQLFRNARSYNGWTDAPIEEDTVRDLYGLLKWLHVGQLEPGAVRLGP